MENIGEAFSYQFKDKQCVSKVLIGGLIFMSCILIFPIPLIIGYMVKNIRNVINKKEELLPAWDNFGELYKDGLKFIGGYIGYLIPVFLYVFLSIIIGVMTAFLDEDSGIAIIFMIPMFFGQMIFMLYSLALNVVMPVFYIKAANQEPIKNFYKFKDLWQFVKNNFGNLLIVILLTWVTGMIASAGIIVIFICFLWTAFYANTIVAHLYAQLYLNKK
jgi:hypothetical protein